MNTRWLPLTPLFLLLALAPCPKLFAQDPPMVAPATQHARVEIFRGRDIVQPPSLWYQEGSRPPNSLGILRVPCCDSGDPDAITYPDALGSYPVNLQVATFVRDGQIAELPLSADVIQGVVPGRIIIRSPAEDFYDIAEPFGLPTIKQVPGDETVIDARTWYDASLRNPNTGQQAPDDRFHTIRELRGRLRSTARGGESVYFYIVAGRTERPVFALTPVMQNPIPIDVPELRTTIDLRVQTVASPEVDWITTTGLMIGPNRAHIPGNNMSTYDATRIKGDVRSTLRWWANPREAYLFTVFGSTQTSISDQGNHHDVPYGLALAARFGGDLAFELRAEASQEDDPFQRQSFSTGDQRLRVLFGYDYMTDETHRRLSVGPTYFRDHRSIWESGRRDARELGFSVDSVWDEKLRLWRIPVRLTSAAQYFQSWGYVRDRGNRNIMVDGRVALKPEVTLGGTVIGVGPVAHLHYTHNVYEAIQGFWDLNAQVGVELTSHVRF